jgi:hypothetical protein
MKYKEAMQTDAKGWTAAVDDEHQHMVDNEVFKIIHCKDVPRGRRVISTTWAMKQKVNSVQDLSPVALNKCRGKITILREGVMHR